jgi:hypothetical protein
LTSDPTVFTDDGFLPVETTNIPTDSQDTSATFGFSCAQTQPESLIQTSTMTSEENCDGN